MKNLFQPKDVAVNSHIIHTHVSKKNSANIPPIVMIHGLSMSHRYLMPTAELLANHFNVYIPEFPGFGDSSKPQKVLNLRELADVLADWMNTLDIKKTILVGNSFGCQIIVEFAARYPDRLTHCVLIGPTMDDDDRTFFGEAFRLAKDFPHEPITSFIPLIIDFSKAGVRRTIQTAQIGLNDPMVQKLPKITAPTLLIRGDKDPITPEDWLNEMSEKIPFSKKVTIKDAGHAVNFNSPEKLVIEIFKFLAETSIQHH